MSGNSSFEIIDHYGWSRGLGNLLRKDLAQWWKTRRWWIQCLVWVCITGFVSGSFAIFNYGHLTLGSAANSLSEFACIVQAGGAIIIMQGILVGEKKDGTTAWILSKPASRPAYILSKLLANGVGILAIV